jgi:hypothetical protein
LSASQTTPNPPSPIEKTIFTAALEQSAVDAIGCLFVHFEHLATPLLNSAPFLRNLRTD